MKSSFWVGSLLVIGGLCFPGSGCNRGDPRVNMVRSQTNGWKEIQKILAEVKDQAGMEKAQIQLAKRFDDFQKMADEARDLDPAVPPEIAEIMRKEGADLQKAINETLVEIQRIRQLPGGLEFLNQFKAALPAS